MKDQIKTNPLNVSGRYYVDVETCLDHECCCDEAPSNFKMDETHSAYVFKQPENAEEEAQCRSAMECCPVEAIHNNGA